MNVTEARDAIRQYYFDNITSGVQPVQFYTQHDNEPLTDNAGAPISKTDSPWVRFSFSIVESNQVEVSKLGSNTHRHSGMSIAQVFVPVDKSDGDAWSISQFIADKFRGVIVGTHVRFSTPSFRVVGRSDSFWQINVICPFHFDEIG